MDTIRTGPFLGTVPFPQMYPFLPHTCPEAAYLPEACKRCREEKTQAGIDPSKGGGASDTRQNLHRNRRHPGVAHVPWDIPAASLWLHSGGTAGSQSLWQRWLCFLMPHEPKLLANLRAQRENKCWPPHLGSLGATSCCQFSFKFKSR